MLCFISTAWGWKQHWILFCFGPVHTVVLAALICFFIDFWGWSTCYTWEHWRVMQSTKENTDANLNVFSPTFFHLALVISSLLWLMVIVATVTECVQFRDQFLINSIDRQWFLLSLSSARACSSFIFVHIICQYHFQSGTERKMIRLMSAVGSSDSDGRLMPICSLLQC